MRGFASKVRDIGWTRSVPPAIAGGCVAVVQFEITPKALANFSPGFERSREPWELNKKSDQTLKGFGNWQTLSGFNDYFVI